MEKTPARIKSMVVHDKIADDGKTASFSFRLAGAGDMLFVCSARGIEQMILKLQGLLNALRAKALDAAADGESADPTVGFHVVRPFGKSHISVTATKKSGITATVLIPISHIDGLLSQIEHVRPQPVARQPGIRKDDGTNAVI